MQKVVGSNPISRFDEAPAYVGVSSFLGLDAPEPGPHDDSDEFHRRRTS